MWTLVYPQNCFPKCGRHSTRLLGFMTTVTFCFGICLNWFLLKIRCFIFWLLFICFIITALHMCFLGILKTSDIIILQFAVHSCFSYVLRQLFQHSVCPLFKYMLNFQAMVLIFLEVNFVFPQEMLTKIHITCDIITNN